MTGTLFNIQRYSIHDGDGIRTLVFFKGCPLRCLWCSNPESQAGGPELGFISSRCPGRDGCDALCVAACPRGAVSFDTEGKPAVDRRACNACGDCALHCLKDALKIVGRQMTVDEVMAEVDKDRPFYRRSGGGITLGGGEPLLQHRFAAGLLEAAHDAYLHTALETCGHAPWHHFEAVLRHTDLLCYDIKHADPGRHRELTGQSNELILDNLRRALSLKAASDILVRVPVVPGCNSSEPEISAIARLVSGLGLHRIELVPYHQLGVAKYGQYGRDYPLRGCSAPAEADMDRLKEVLEQSGLTDTGGRI